MRITNNQISITKAEDHLNSFGTLNLVIGIYLELGAWAIGDFKLITNNQITIIK